ncbi:hypothetical protein ALC152_05040 [Arcobacter sp. 15-2]|uniref:hypothetical protein n=1 Tax=Arcobacter sp. 15-2 TaxID=3374109 RepID=UPI00399CE4F7
MLNTYKTTITARNYELQSINLQSRELKFLQAILNQEITDANITVCSIRRKSFGFMFIDFKSTNSKTLEENFKEYYSVTEVNIIEKIEKELELAS